MVAPLKQQLFLVDRSFHTAAKKNDPLVVPSAKVLVDIGKCSLVNIHGHAMPATSGYRAK